MADNANEKMFLVTCFLLTTLSTWVGISGLDNGLALTPPMGWLSWERYLCNTDCENDPDNCISEHLYKTMADLLVSGGYRDVGYEYVNIDDCWMTKTRDSNGSLVPDPERFPSGMKALADYVHSKGLKLGIYEDFGTHTCGGYPGSKFYMEKDANTFASWGIDMVKLDGCYTDIADMDEGYPAMEFFMNQTGRPMLYSCSWPAYVVFSKKVPDYTKIAEFCNIWRNYGDISDSWDSVKSIIEFYGKDEGNFSKIAGPGHFNDPDMLIIGNFGLSYEQQKVQMALWAIMAAPLLMSNDLRNIPSQSKALLKNKGAIAINQDVLGVQGVRLLTIGHIELWVRPLFPRGQSMAFAVLNLSGIGGPSKDSIPMKTIAAGVLKGGKYDLTEVFSGKVVGTYKTQDSVNVTVDPSGVYLGRLDLHK